MQVTSFQPLSLQFGAKKTDAKSKKPGATKPKAAKPAGKAAAAKPVASAQFANKFEEASAGIEAILEKNKIGGYVEIRNTLDDVLVHLDKADDRQKAESALQKAGLAFHKGPVQTNISFRTQGGSQVSVSITVPQKAFIC